MESGSKKPYCRLIRQGHFSASCQMQERRNRKARTAGGRRRISEPARGELFGISVDSGKKMCYDRKNEQKHFFAEPKEK